MPRISSIPTLKDKLLSFIVISWAMLLFKHSSNAFCHKRISFVLVRANCRGNRNQVQKMRVATWFFGVFALIDATRGARILAVVPTPTKSHHYLIEKLALDLVGRGHHVTLMTAFKQEKAVKNLEEIIYPNYYDDMMKSFTGENDSESPDLSKMKKHAIASAYYLSQMGLYMTDRFLSTPVVQSFLRSDRKYDVVIGEAFLIEAILAGFVRKYNAPLIAVATGPTSFFSNYMVGNPSPSSYVPSLMLDYTNEMTFAERVINFVTESASAVYFNIVHLPKQEMLMRKHFPSDSNLPFMSDTMTNTSLLLVNHHHSLAFPRPNLPNVIEIGGFHVKPVSPLPRDIKQYMDDAKHGVILLSMGSHMKSSYIPKETVHAIVKAFSRLKESVIWKFDDPNVPDLPKNVKIMKWVPQSDVLAHPNMKLLITHGGMLSITEAVLRGVPMIGLPVFGDQPSNMRFIERAGCGKSLSIVGLTENVLYDAVTEILQNPMYKNNAKTRSILLQDTPLPASEMAMYWIEYVIRHKGAPHLRSAAVDLKYYQLHLFDVFTVLLIPIVAVTWIAEKILSSIFSGRKPSKASSRKRKMK